jgi:putative ABC transport system permease protein
MLTLSVYRTLSLRYLRKRWTRATLIVLSIALGVATVVATCALNHTMTVAAQSATNPLAGFADLLVHNGEAPIERALGKQIAGVPGVRRVSPILVDTVRVRLPDEQERPVLLLGFDLLAEGVAQQKDPLPMPWGVEVSPETIKTFEENWLFWDELAVVGKDLNDELGSVPTLLVRAAGKTEAVKLRRAGTVSSQGSAAGVVGNLLIMDLSAAARLAGQSPRLVSRLDVTLQPGADREKVRQAIVQMVAGKGQVQTPEEQNQSIGSAMAGMQVGFALSGLAALLVALFLVYNALSVSVAERRHEIGVLRALGATRGQVGGLFAAEAGFLGVIGAVVGLPLGVLLAQVGLGPVQAVLRDLGFTIDARHVEVTWATVITAKGLGLVTTLVAVLFPIRKALAEDPASAVRRSPQLPTWEYRFLQIVVSGSMIVGGTVVSMARGHLPARVGMYGGMMAVLLGALLATPLLTAALAQLVQPLARRFLGIEGRLAADNLVRSPGRTGLVIGALAAGVALIVQTAGSIRSNRQALSTWLNESIAADLIVISRTPNAASGQPQPMDPGLRLNLEHPARSRAQRQLGSVLATLPGVPPFAAAVLPAQKGLGELSKVEAAVPFRRPRLPYRDTRIVLTAVDAGAFYQVDRKRAAHVPGLELYRVLDREPGTAIVSDNFAALYGIGKGDPLTLLSHRGPVTFRVIGQVTDYYWNHGSIIINRSDYLKQFDDPRVDEFHLFLRPGADRAAVQQALTDEFGADLMVMSRNEVQRDVDNIIERIYSIAYAQQVVVGLVAALGVVTALLISVLQRRRELGLLRAIGASRAQVLRSVLAEALLMGVIGTIIGVAVGVPMEWYILEVVMLEESGFLFPLLVPWLEAGVIALAALLVATLAGLGPAVHAVQERIPEAIAYE